MNGANNGTDQIRVGDSIISKGVWDEITCVRAGKTGDKLVWDGTALHLTEISLDIVRVGDSSADNGV